MARKRTQKTVSARIDRSYIARPHRWRRMRRAAVFAVSAAAILFIAFTTSGGNGELIHNPGRLTFVHAKFQNNCAACHDGCDQNGKPTGKFNLAVSDAACLKCHDAGIHHNNQATMVVSDTRFSPPQMRSADCTVCHTEHRGQDALVSKGDALCVDCHRDLNGKTIKAPPAEVPLTVTAFDLESHPHFGRALMVGGKAIDPTVLRFNHKKHMGVLKGEQQNCTWCHDPSPAAATSLVWESGKTAYALPGGQTAAPQPIIDGTERHRSLTQVNYAKNCQTCHDLGTLPGSTVAIPHGDMSDVRQVILAYVTDAASPWQKYAPDRPGSKEKPLNDRIISKLAPPSDYSDAMDALTKAVKTSPLYPRINIADLQAKLPADLAAKLAAAAVKLPTNVVAAADRTRVSADISATVKPAEHLRALLVATLRKKVDAKELAQFDAAFARYSQDSPDPRLFEFYVAYANDAGVSCVKCHDMEGNTAAVPPEWSLLSTQSKPAAEAEVFRIKPTGIPAGPRRWYVNSEFNHDAHRSMNCLECHSSALASEKTTDLLLPDIQWQGMIEDSSGELTPATRSCFECHHPDTEAAGPGAASNCTECHIYHDRSHERLTKPLPLPKALAAASP